MNEVYLLDLKNESMMPYPKREDDFTEPVKYTAWFERMVKKEIFAEDVFGFTECMEISKLKESVKRGGSFSYQFRLNSERGHIWWIVYHHASRDGSLIVLENIHKKRKKEWMEKSNEFYHWMRKRMTLMEKMEKEFGVLVLELKDGDKYKTKYISTEFKKALSGYYHKEISKHKKVVEEFIQSLLGRQREVTSEIEFIRIRMENDTSCWIQLYGKVFYTVSGRIFIYLMAVNAFDYQNSMSLHNLQDYVENYIFEWNIEDDKVEVSGPWDKKFADAGEEIHKGHEIEKYIYKNDLIKFQKISNLVLSGKSQEDILLRFYVKDGPKEYCWCTVSFISVMYDNNVPMFAIGRVKDIDTEVSRITKIPDMESKGERAEKNEQEYIEAVLSESAGTYLHALIAIDFKVLSGNKGEKIGITQNGEFKSDILSKKWVENFSEVLCPSDSLLLEGSVLYIFLYGIDRRPAELKAVRIRRFLEALGEGTVVTNMGLAMWPENGPGFGALKEAAYDALKTAPIRRADYSTSVGELQIDENKEGYSSVKLMDMMDEWYSSVRMNKQLQDQMELVESQLLLSQIKPHFIYNVLANIKALIYSDQDQAAECLVKLTRYLRGNFENFGKEDLYPFQQVLDTMDHYIELEKCRFGEKIRYIKEIDYSDFLFPYFILQPLVENAIRHGICKRDTPGTLGIKTYKEHGKIKIIIEDDGIGFELHGQKEREGRVGIGIKNVELRLKYLLEGKMSIESQIGKGTRIELIFPESS